MRIAPASSRATMRLIRAGSSSQSKEKRVRAPRQAQHHRALWIAQSRDRDVEFSLGGGRAGADRQHAIPISSAAPPAREFAKPAVGPAQAVPMAEIKPVIAAIFLVMKLMMARRYQPFPRLPLNDPRRKHLPSHVICHAHQRHDRQHTPKHRDMDRDQNTSAE